MTPLRPTGTRADHLKFCQTERWEEVTNARGKAIAHHRTFRLHLPDGDILRTRISHPAHSPQRYSQAMWTQVLGPKQLRVTPAQFWACVERGELPDRGRTTPAPGAEAIPLAIVHQLVREGVPQAEVAAMSRTQALARLQALWNQE